MRDEKRFCPWCGGRLGKIAHDHRMRLFCAACNTPLYENPLPATAAVVLSADDHLLLVKRGMEPEKGDRRWPFGQWCLPGGFVESDETPAQGVIRELQPEVALWPEETGRRWPFGHLIGAVEQLIDCVYPEVALWPEDSPFYGPLIIMGYELAPGG
jgi:NADH pyrophosphatase NudC (nudix superfamily)